MATAYGQPAPASGQQSEWLAAEAVRYWSRILRTPNGPTMTAMRTSGYAARAVRAARAAGSPEGELARTLRERLVPPMPPATLWGWLGPVLVTVFGGFLRFYRLGAPHAVVFDETYYAPDAYGILKHGVEINHVKHINTLLVHGSTHIFATGSG